MNNQSRKNTEPSRGITFPPGYGIVEPVANYRPWDVDEEFQEVFRTVREHTMVDIYRLWVLWTLAGRATEGVILEVGTWRGGSGALIARAASRHAGSDPPPRVLLADTFTGVVKAGERDTYYTGSEHDNTSATTVRDLLADLDLDWVELLVGVFPEDAPTSISELRISFCHVDVDVYQSARDTFDWVWPRTVPGGVVVFDDYGFYGCEGVTACVNEIMQQFPHTVIVPNLSGQAVIVKG